jgi:hypothetical protein
MNQQSGLMSAVFLVDGDRDRLTRVAGPHLPNEWRQATGSRPLTPTTSTCGAAVFRCEPVIVAAVSSDLLFDGFQELARAAIGGLPVLEITSGDHWTTVRARLPLVKDAA